jgi:hypothetical protein
LVEVQATEPSFVVGFERDGLASHLIHCFKHTAGTALAYEAIDAKPLESPAQDSASWKPMRTVRATSQFLQLGRPL